MVQQVITDKGGEFVNTEIETWYSTHGIEHVKVGPKSSQLNACERTHRSLGDMTKTKMKASGFPRSMWCEAFMYAVYIKNRIYCKGVQGAPYEQMFGIRPDIHH